MQQLLPPHLAPGFPADGLPPIRFHDLRHTGNQFAADEGANVRELMDRMGHSTTRAVMACLTAATSDSRPSRTR